MNRKNISSLRLVLGACGLFLGVLLFVFFHIFIPKSLASDPVFVTIPRGATGGSVARLLEARGVIRSAKAFVLYAQLTSSSKRLRAGTFSVSPSFSVANILGHLTQESGAARYIKVTFPEGFDLHQMDAELSRSGIFKEGEFYTYMTTRAKKELEKDFSFLSEIPGDNVEGYCFPSTYYFTELETLQSATRVMFSTFQKKMFPIWEGAVSTNQFVAKKYTFHEVLTMASIVQKEARVESEMPRIASVYYNRLKINMRLEADPTVIYGLGLTQKDRLYYKDTRKDTPYNTYRRKGLTPTPIASPGVQAFAAACYPEVTPFLFFVASQDGTHIFTKTYKDHLRVQSKR